MEQNDISKMLEDLIQCIYKLDEYMHSIQDSPLNLSAKDLRGHIARFRGNMHSAENIVNRLRESIELRISPEEHNFISNKLTECSNRVELFEELMKKYHIKKMHEFKSSSFDDVVEFIESNKDTHGTE